MVRSTGLSYSNLYNAARLRVRSARDTVRYTKALLHNRGVNTDQIHWILMATLPNSGSTAFARVLETSPSVTLVNGKGEGQWFLSDMCRERERWQPDHRVNYGRVRHVWTHSVITRNPQASYVFDKSPPIIVRFERLMEALGGADKTSLISFSRDPVAICASWIKRYSPSQVAEEWEPLAREEREGAGFYRKIGEICGKRLDMLARARDVSRLHITYEELCANPAAVTGRLSEVFPNLEVGDPEVRIAVKDYAPQPLRNMNAEQRALLSPEQLSAVLDGLSAYAGSVERLGYTLS